ncbi:MAG: LysR family transcriptional regulator [Clostridia bacterium]|nr:LysR family transcriptional regulator [Clostridia bacterium]
MYNPQLDTFTAVAELGSFSKAAEKLYITPTAVMKQINALESHLGFALFFRTNHGLSLTAAGRSFLEDTKYILNYSARAIEKARNIDAAEGVRPIRIGTSIMTPAKFLLDIWSQIQAADPSLKIELIPFDNTPENAREILSNLGKHIDMVAGIYDKPLIEYAGCRVAHLADKRIALAFPLTHPLAGKERITTDDIRGQSVMLVRTSWHDYVDGLRQDLTRNGAHIVDFDFYSLNVFNEAVKQNLPIMVIDGWENIHPLMKIIPIEWQHSIPFGIMYGKEPSRQVASFIKIIQHITK